MREGIAFQTRARTIDHLGRGQIADAPTAISELWKNAYDAYARNVSLHIFDGERDVAAILDDGVGMTYDDLIRRWLVIGTESKLEDSDEAAPDTLGLPPRPRQGEKGIGRLSVAFLAPCTVLISKRSSADFVVVAVDWRLFENPFIALDDIRLPVERFQSAEAVVIGLPSVLETITANLGAQGSERENRLADGWNRFSDYERRHGAAGVTADAVRGSWQRMALTRRHLEEWPVFLGLAEHGTALFMIDLNHELDVWVQRDKGGEEVEEVKDRLRQTLTAFTDPYSEDRPEFDYEVYVHRGDNSDRIIGASEVFGIDGLRDLEHYVDGEFNERGTFTGRVVAFGQDLGLQTFVPRRPPPTRGRDTLGPFKFAIGTFEVDERRSTHSEQQHAMIVSQAERYAGVALYRDLLRVMPYGRPDADFLGLEERRSKSAGREFWAHRRSFGRIGISRSANPALRDKAGREGLVDNRAFREMRILVVEFLKDAARKYFGSDSALRQEVLPGIMERKALQKEAAEHARARRRKGMRQFLREKATPLDEAIRRADALLVLANATLTSKDKLQATVLAARVRDVRLFSDDLRPPSPPARLGELEDQWRNYRDGYQALVDRLQDLARLTAEVESSVEAEAPSSVLARTFVEREGSVVAQLDKFASEIDDRMGRLRQVWRDHQAADGAELKRLVGHVLEAKVTSTNLLGLINFVDANYNETSEKISWKYRSFLGTLDQLIEGIDLEGAYAITEDDRADLEEQLRDIRAVAQIGITVEIIGHEFETLESEVRRNLGKLPPNVRSTEPYNAALRAHLALADRLRFLAPLKIGGYRARERISGEQIASYIEEFFSKLFMEQRIEFTATTAFRSIHIKDLPSRIHPVFINLINNAIYWCSLSTERRIILDFVSGLVILGDTGPGVDPEDVSRLFGIFFSRRRSGRGVGLYLSRANLAVAGHKIRYATDDDPKVSSGANFVIEFKGVVSDGR